LPVYLEGLSLQFYRGIGSEMQRMHPFKDFNFFIGANNAGKSTILSFISENLPLPGGRFASAPKSPNPLNDHRGRKSGQMQFGLVVAKGKFVKAASQRYASKMNAYCEGIIEDIAELLSENGSILLLYDRSTSDFKFEKNLTVENTEHLIDATKWRDIWIFLTEQGAGSIRQHWIPESIKFLIKTQDTDVTEVKLIPALRQIGKEKGAALDFSGQGLIEKLAQIQSPDHDRQDDKNLFARINSFLRDVTDKPEARY
jgi:type I site-specific restriction-modification system R (restriction) subunit